MSVAIFTIAGHPTAYYNVPYFYKDYWSGHPHFAGEYTDAETLEVTTAHVFFLESAGKWILDNREQDGTVD